MTRIGIVLSLLLLAAAPLAPQQPPSAEQMQAMLAKMRLGPEHDLLRFPGKPDLTIAEALFRRRK